MFFDLEQEKTKSRSSSRIGQNVKKDLKANRQKLESLRKKNSMEAFFYLLWKKDKMFENKLRLNIPNTAFFKHGGMTLWYFSDRNHEIKRKKEKNCTLEGFKEMILRRKPMSKLGIAIQVLTFDKEVSIGISS